LLTITATIQPKSRPPCQRQKKFGRIEGSSSFSSLTVIHARNTSWKVFFSSFNDADQLLLLDIYSAGEKAEEGIDSQRIAEGVKEFGHKNVEYIGGTESVIPHLQKILKPGDIVMTLGAGNIGELSHKLASRFND